MISLRLNKYTEHEVRMLSDLMTHCVLEITDKHCIQDCRYCDCKKVCTDITNCIVFLDKEMSEHYPHIDQN